MINHEELMEILEIGMRAISTCNNQPWRFRVNGDELQIFMLRTKNFFLKLEGNTWIELGTMLENLAIGAAAKGYGIEYRLFERCGLDEPAAILRFVAGSAQGVTVDLEPLIRRCTNRAAYHETPLSSSVQETIFKACDVEDIEIQILTGRRKNRCAEILNHLENIRLGNRIMLEEVLPYLRTDEKEIALYRDRLDARTLDLDAGALKMMKIAKRNPKVMSFIYTFLGRLGLTSKKEFEKKIIKSGAMISFLLKKRDQQTYVNLGRVAQRILNNLTAQNIQTYTMVSGLYLLDLLKENLEIYSKREQLLLLRYQYDLQSLFDFTDKRIALFIRAGYAAAPQLRTLRKSVREVMIDSHGNAI
jgi:hypothetical protein